MFIGVPVVHSACRLVESGRRVIFPISLVVAPCHPGGVPSAAAALGAPGASAPSVRRRSYETDHLSIMTEPERLPRTLGLWSSVALVVGITIGSGIFRT